MVSKKTEEKKKKLKEVITPPESPFKKKEERTPAPKSPPQEENNRPEPNQILRNEKGTIIGFTDTRGIAKFVGRKETEEFFGGKGALTAQEQQNKLEAEQTAKREQALQEGGFFEGAVDEPERVELDPTKSIGISGKLEENLPVFGRSMVAIQDALQGTFFNKKKHEPLITDPETVRELALQEIQNEVIQEGLSTNEKFGAFIEGIPIAGGAVSKYASGLIETPAGNARTIVQNILNEKERALNTKEMVQSGRLDPAVALERLDGIEENIVGLEQRLKLLLENSASLKADGDTVNKFETEILRTRERVKDARDAAFGVIIAPTDAGIHIALTDLQEKNKQF